MKTASAILAALLVATPAVAMEPLRYSTTVAGIPLGKMKVFLETEGTQYAVGISFQMIPILRQILNGDANADVEGAVVDGRYLPRESIFRYAGRKGEKRLAIGFDETGDPVDLDADPPIRKTDYRMSLDEAAGAIDPATAAALLMAPRDAPCEIAFDVFDGTKRHRISLTGASSPKRGDSVTCSGLYERVNGFKAKYMTPERRSWPFTATLTAWDGRWVPVKITANTKFGPASATLRR